MTALPAVFMTAVTTTYILVAQEGFCLDEGVSCFAGAVAAAALLCLYLVFLYRRVRRK